MSIKDNFPSVGPSLSLNFARSKTLDPRITFSRPSTSGDATYMNENGLIVTAAADEPRFDHKYENGVVKSLGLLVERQRTNVLLYSEEFDTGWTITNAGITTNATTAPDGTQTADKLVENSSTGNKEVNQGNITYTSGTSLTFSCFAKAAGRTRFRFAGTTARFDSGTNAFFDLSNGTIPARTGGFTSASMEEYPNGWYRCVGTMLPTSSGTNNVFITLVNSGTTSDYTGDGSSGIFIWGAQLEVGAFPTSYIPTSGSEATRSPDNVFMTGTNFSDWYNQSEGTILASHKTVLETEPGYARIWSINDGTANNAYAIYYPNGSKIEGFKKVSGSSNFIGGTLSTGNNNVIKKTAFSYDGSAGAVATNGENPVTYSVSGNLTLSRLNIGAREFNDPTSSIHISQLAYYPKRLTNTQLQNLTK